MSFEHGTESTLQFLRYAKDVNLVNRIQHVLITGSKIQAEPAYQQGNIDDWLKPSVPPTFGYSEFYSEVTELELKVSEKLLPEPSHGTGPFFRALARLGYEFRVRDLVATFNASDGYSWGLMGIRLKIVTELKYAAGGEVRRFFAAAK